MNGQWSWHGAVALTLAIGLVVVLVIVSGPWDPDPLSENGGNVLLAIVGALAAYLGFSVGGEVPGRIRTHAEVSEAPRIAPMAPETSFDWQAEPGSDERMDENTLARVRYEGEQAEAERQRKIERRGE
jgi:hypothetical protein